MSYLRFEKALMTNLEESLKCEILRTNRSGAYSCTTIVECNTRKYHGALVVPIPEMDNENHVLLSSLDVTVVQHGAEFNLGLHKYQGNNYSPKGHKYITEFDCDSVPTTIYRVGGVILKKEVVFQHYEDRLLIRYTLVDCHTETSLRFRPFLAFRSVKQFTHENSTASRDYQHVAGGIKTCMYAGYPDLYMQFSSRNEFVFTPDWYRGVDYPKERERGYEANEDLYVPGYFEMPMKKGQQVVFSASTSEIKTTTLKNLFQEEVDARAPRDNFFPCLVNAAHQFHYRTKNDERFIIAGYPWFKCRARDMFVALPGLTLSIGEPHYFELVMTTAARRLEKFMETGELSKSIDEIDRPDVLLWAVWALQQFAASEGRARCMELYGSLLEKIMDYLLAGKHPLLRLDLNGLIWSDGGNDPVTWMNSTSNGVAVVNRRGYIVEFNALWYNALMFCQDIAAETWSAEKLQNIKKISDKCAESFVPMFVNEHGYLFDYVYGGEQDWSVRPNMIFAAALEYSPLDKAQQKNVLDFCTRELLSPSGLRSLSPKSEGYNPIYKGQQYDRDQAYHMGTSWPWLMGFYTEACLKIYKRTRISMLERLMDGFEASMRILCIGSIPELTDGNPPYTSRGAISFAMSVGEVLRAMKMLESYTDNN